MGTRVKSCPALADARVQRSDQREGTPRARKVRWQREGPGQLDQKRKAKHDVGEKVQVFLISLGVSATLFSKVPVF